MLASLETSITVAGVEPALYFCVAVASHPTHGSDWFSVRLPVPVFVVGCGTQRGGVAAGVADCV